MRDTDPMPYEPEMSHYGDRPSHEIPPPPMHAAPAGGGNGGYRNGELSSLARVESKADAALRELNGELRVPGLRERTATLHAEVEHLKYDLTQQRRELGDLLEAHRRQLEEAIGAQSTLLATQISQVVQVIEMRRMHVIERVLYAGGAAALIAMAFKSLGAW